MLVCLEPRRRHMGDVEALPLTEFLRSLWDDGFAESAYPAAFHASTTRRGSSALSRVITCSVPVFVRAPTSAGRIDG